MPLLTPADAGYLLRVLPLPQQLKRRLDAFQQGQGVLTTDDQDDLRELVEDRLAAVGFEVDGRLTPAGERLADVLELLFTD